MQARELPRSEINVEGLRPIVLPPLQVTPPVSVLVTNYNYAALLPGALDSLLGQTYWNWEAVVVDDGSTDDSVAILKRYAAQDARIHLVAQANGGQSAAFTTGMEHVRGAIVCFLDSDDRFDPTKIETVVNCFRAAPEAGICNHFMRAVNREGAVIVNSMPNNIDAGWLAPEALRRGGAVDVPMTSAMSFRIEVLRLLLPLPAGQRTDVDGYLAMASQFVTAFAKSSQVLSSYTVHGSNMGGLIDLNIPRLRHEMRLIEIRTESLRKFLVRSFSSALAGRVTEARNPHYLQTVLKLRAIGDSQDCGGLGRNTSIIARHPNQKWRVLWRLLLMLPLEVRLAVLPRLSRLYGMKSAVLRVMGQRKAAPTAPEWCAPGIEDDREVQTQ